MPAPPIIETPRLILRPLTRDDAPAMFDLARHDIVTRYVSWPSHRTIDDTYAFIDLTLGKYERGESYIFAITLREADGGLIGVVGCDEVNAEHKYAYWGWWIGEPHWGRGYMTEAAKHAIDWQFNNTDVHRIAAMAMPENPASWRVMEKIGMTYEGTLRECRIVKGQTISLRYYSILRSEWMNNAR